MNGKTVVISDKVLKDTGTYEITLNFIEFGGGCLVVGIEEDSLKNSSSYWNNKPALCITCKNLDAI